MSRADRVEAELLDAIARRRAARDREHGDGWALFAILLAALPLLGSAYQLLRYLRTLF